MNAEELPLKGRGIKPLVSLRAHPRLAAGVALGIVLAGLPVAWQRGIPTYSTESVFQVAPRYMKNLREDLEMEFQSNTQYRQFVQHSMRSVTRYDILRDALNSLKDKRSLWQRPEETERKAIERLREKLVVAAVPDTYLVRISLSDRKKEGLAEVVNAVTTVFLQRMQSEDIYGSDTRSTNLLRRERELLTYIADKAEQRGVIARDLSLTTFNEGTPNPYDGLVVSLRTRVADARHRRIDAEAAQAAFQSADDTQISVRSVNDAVLNDPGLNSLKAALFKRRADLLVTISGLKPDHPQRLAAEREFKEIEAEIKSQGERLRVQVNSNLRQRLAGTADQARQVEKALEEELKALEAQATQFAGLFQRAMLLTTELTQARLELEKVRDRLSYLNVEASSLGFLRLVTSALPAEIPQGPGRKKLLLMVLVAAAAAGLLAPTIKDLLDRRIHTVNDVEKLMGIAPVGWQVDRTDSATELFAREQLRRLASGLLRARDSGGHRIFGFTGIRPGVGCTTIVLELGGVLKSLGFNVLLVEANCFKPDSRFASERPGLVDTLKQRVEASAIVNPASDEDPAWIASGQRIGGGGDEQQALVRLDLLRRLLDNWATAYDFVLVDMPPLLTASDAELLARTVRNTLLVVQAGTTERGELLRARRLLMKIDPESVGVVVNRVAPFSGGGYLKEQIIESVTGDAAKNVFSLPSWRLQWDLWRLRRQQAKKK